MFAGRPARPFTRLICCCSGLLALQGRSAAVGDSPRPRLDPWPPRAASGEQPWSAMAASWRLESRPQPAVAARAGRRRAAAARRQLLPSCACRWVRLLHSLATHSSSCPTDSCSFPTVPAGPAQRADRSRPGAGGPPLCGLRCSHLPPAERHLLVAAGAVAGHPAGSEPAGGLHGWPAARGVVCRPAPLAAACGAHGTTGPLCELRARSKRRRAQHNGDDGCGLPHC